METALQLAGRLIRLDTTTGVPTEPDGLRLLADIFDGHPEYRTVITEHPQTGRPAALVVVPAHPQNAKLLLLSGHVDTVTAVPDNWSFDPWAGDIVDGQLRGRGATDMKGGLAALVTAMLQAGPHAPVALAVSTEEEWGCAGTPHVIDALKAAGVGTTLQVGSILVAEPTDGDIYLGHRGPLWFNVTIGGVPAHGSTPERGQSAILKAADLIVRANRDFPRRTHPHLGVETINFGRITGGTMRNVVPDRVDLEVDVRTTYPDPQPLLQWWRNQPEVDEVTLDSVHPAVWTDVSDPWVASLPGTVVEQPASYGTEAAPLGAALGWPPTVIWGPGQTSAMHVIDETVSASAVEKAAASYLQAIRNWQALQ